MWQTKYALALLNIWEWEWIFGRVVKAISSTGVHSLRSVRLTLYTSYNSLGPHNCIYTSSTCAKKSSFIIHYVERKKNYLTTTCTLPHFFEKNKWFMMWNCFFFLGKFTMHFTLEHWLSFQLWPLDGAQVEAPICESWYGCPLVVRSWTNLYFLFLSLLIVQLNDLNGGSETDRAHIHF